MLSFVGSLKAFVAVGSCGPAQERQRPARAGDGAATERPAAEALFAFTNGRSNEL
jgi:hypothetical protein